MKKCIAILAVALFVVSVGPGFAQQPPETSTTDRPALEDQRLKTAPAKSTDKPGALTPERQKSDSDNPMAGEQTRPDKKAVKKSDKSTKRHGQTPAREKTTDGPAADGQYMPPVPERK